MSRANVHAYKPVDPEGLEKKTYLTAREAAVYTNYTGDQYPDPMHAFYDFIRRAGDAIPKCGTARRLLFKRTDIDRYLESRGIANFDPAVLRRGR